MDELRLGDIIDDYCIKCRRLTNHAVVSIVDGEAAKVRCRSCYHDHTYLREIIPPSKKDLKKLELAALAGLEGEPVVEPAIEADADLAAEPVGAPAVPIDAPALEPTPQGRVKKA